MNLITGATGIVGAHLALQLLQQNQSVVALKRSNSDIQKTKKLFSYYTADYEVLFQKIKWVDGDVCDVYSIIEALEGISTVFHCAGFVSFNKKQYEQLFKINGEGTANVVNACLEKNVGALCHVSSIATLQNPDITHCIDESVFWKSSPQASNYAISKYNAEREVWRGIEEGLNAVIVNPGAIITPGFWEQSSGKIIQTCYKGNLFYTNGGTGYIAASDVAKCMIHLVKEKQFGKRFVLVEGNYSYQEILTQIHAALSKKPPFIKANKQLLILAAWLEKIRCFFTQKEPLITQQLIPALIEKNIYNSEKIKQTIPFKLMPIEQYIKFMSQVFIDEQLSKKG